MKTRTRHTQNVSRALACFLGAGLALAPQAIAAPKGAKVLRGNVQFRTVGGVTTIWASHNSIINYKSFNIGAFETVRFVQPGANARVLNRITGSAPTLIEGRLLANGQVYLVNPAGVMFGSSATVNVGGLYAAAANISNNDFVNGINRFTRASGNVQNYGTISADFVAMFGEGVANHGQIKAKKGTVVMASGENLVVSERLGHLHVRLDANGARTAEPLDSSGRRGLDLAAGDVFTLAAWNTGSITGETVHVESAGDRTVVSGSINARGWDGGSVKVLGEHVELAGASIDASGVRHGGSVNIGGGLRGQTADRRAETVSIDAASSVAADSLYAGDGGSLIVWSDSSTVIDGSLSARGGWFKGDGGFVETSSAGLFQISSAPDASALAGKGGEWLIDPLNLFIIADAGDARHNESFIEAKEINKALDLGMDVTLTTSDLDGTADGNIFQFADATIFKSVGGDAKLTMLAANSITLLGGVESRGGGRLHLELVAADPAQADQLGGAPFGVVTVDSRLSLGGGTLEISGNQIRLFDRVTAGSVDLAAPGFILIDRSVRTTEGGMRVDAGTLTLSESSSLSLAGDFVHTGGDVFLGADINSRGNDVIFGGDVWLIDDVVINAFGGVEDTPLVRFGGDLNSGDFDDRGGGGGQAFFLSVDAGNGNVRFAGDVGNVSQLEAIRARGRNVFVNDVTTLYQQQYIADTLHLDGSVLETTGGEDPRSARIEVLADAMPGLGFRGNTRLSGNSVVRSAGAFADTISFAGDITSVLGGERVLRVDAGKSVVTFGGDIGAGAFSNARLGLLEVLSAAETELHGSVFTTQGMNFFSPVEVWNPDTVLHVGDGVGLFGSDIYSAAEQFNDILFDFDGMPWIGLGEARVPFKFRGNIGEQTLFARGFGDARFGTIRLGGDLAGVPTSATFLFDSNALPGLALSPNLGDGQYGTHYLSARDSIIAGAGQKITAFQSLALETVGDADGFRSQIVVGDINVLGDLVMTAIDPDGGQIVFRVRDGGLVEGTFTEDDRLAGLLAQLRADIGAEIITSGAISLSAGSFSRIFDGSSRSGSVLFASNDGGMLMNGEEILVFEGGVSSALFRSAFADGETLYPYDLAIFGMTPPDPGPEPDSFLAQAIPSEAPWEPRYPERYLPQRDVLEELALNPQDMALDTRRSALDAGLYLVLDTPGRPNPSVAARDYAVTMDRVSHDAGERLVEAYTVLLGQRVAADEPARQRTGAVRDDLAALWQAFEASGIEDAANFEPFVAELGDERGAVVNGVRLVLTRIQQLELSAFERGIARARFLEMLRPDDASPEAWSRAFLDRSDALASLPD